MPNLQELPRLCDSLSYLYVEHAVIERRDSALLVLQETGRTAVPTANLCVLLLGPGTSLTHAAVGLLGESGTSVVWSGQDGCLFYAQGMGETQKAGHLIRQARLVSNPELRLQVVLHMYEKRFGHSLPEEHSLEQIRGMDGARMRNAYRQASRHFGIQWEGRKYDRRRWSNADPANRALSAANAVLNGICHAAIVSGGYSPGLGFLHTGWRLSFVYDIADLYKTELTIPLAFQIVSEGIESIENRVRQACRERFREARLLERILPDIDALLNIKSGEEELEDRLELADYWWQPIGMDEKE